MTTDPWDLPETKAWAEHVRTELIPNLTASAATISLVPADPASTDVKFAVELGLSVLLDKPIILVVQPGTRLPEHLVRVADEIVELDLSSSAGQERLTAAIGRVLGEPS